MGRHGFVLSALLSLATLTTTAQQAASIVATVPEHQYWSMTVSIDVDAPVDKVWARVGKFCDISEWMQSPVYPTCTILHGDGGLGSVRSVATEVMVGKTQYGYTYAAGPREGVPYGMNHGTLLAEPLTAKTTRLSWTAFQDNAVQPDEAIRTRDTEARRVRLTGWLANMKTLAEGGKLTGPSPAVSRPSTVPFVNANPHYVATEYSIEVNAPIDKVWARVGKFCDLGEWGGGGCTIVSGKDGEVAASRKTGTAQDVIVATSRYSYTYTLPPRAGRPYSMYHGTLEARAKSATITTLCYFTVTDDSALADDAAREKSRDRSRGLFNGFLTNMKTFAEGGTLPAAAQ